MATLFRLKRPGQKRAHTCDARCYNAKGTTCRCFCGGANHGVGFQAAVMNSKLKMQYYAQLGCEVGKGLAEAILNAVKELGGEYIGQ